MEQIETLKKNQISSITRREHMRMKLSRLRDGFMDKIVLVLTVISAVMILFIFFFILQKAWKVLQVNKLGFVFNQGFDTQVNDAYHAPAGQPQWVFGAVGLLLGSLTTTLGALVIAIPMGIGTAIVIAELAPSWVRSFLQSIVKLLASIPSIIYGLIGVLVVIPFLKQIFITVDMQIAFIRRFQLTGNSMLAGIVVLSIMIIPVVIALSVDAINAVPRKYKEASLALGLSHWRTIVKVVIPAAKSGILAGIVLATGRGIGEAIALSMVSGGIGNVPNPADGFVFFLTPVLSLASVIINKSEAMAVPSIESALFACGVLLLITSTSLSLFTKIVETFIKRREGIE